MAKETIIRIIVTVIAFSIGGLHIAYPSITIDLITLGFLLIALVPWLSPIVKSIEVTGLGKIELQELSRRVEAAEGAAESASKKAELAIAPISVAAAPEHETAIEAKTNRAALELQVQEYNKIRDTMKAGGARTTAMTSVVRQMIDLARNLSTTEIAEWLQSENRGQRLAAYAHLYAIPNFQMLTPLVESVVGIEDKPFGQYWGLQAITKILASEMNQKVPASVLKSLKEFATTLQRGTDRDYELKRILQYLSGRVDEMD